MSSERITDLIAVMNRLGHWQPAKLERRRALRTPQQFRACTNMRLKNLGIPLTRETARATAYAIWLRGHEAFSCSYCGGGDVVRRRIDHIIPLSCGGRHSPWNIAPACFRCNSAKAARVGYLEPAIPEALTVSAWCAATNREVPEFCAPAIIVPARAVEVPATESGAGYWYLPPRRKKKVATLCEVPNVPSVEIGRRSLIDPKWDENWFEQWCEEND